MAKPSVVKMLEWALPHSKNAPTGSYPIPQNKVASEKAWKYVLGTIYDLGTPELLERKRKKHYADWNKDDFNRRAKAKYGYICTECQGVADAFFSVVEKVKTDVNANMNYTGWCSSGNKGSNMKKMPRLLGVAVYIANGSGRVTHVGFVCGFAPDGDPLVFEARGYKDDVMITKFSQRPWNRWGIMDKKYDYAEAEKLTAKLLADTPAPPIKEDDYPYTVYGRSQRGGPVNRRYSPSDYHDVKILAKIADGTKMLAATKTPVDGWYPVQVGSKTGYMHGDYVKMK